MQHPMKFHFSVKDPSISRQVFEFQYWINRFLTHLVHFPFTTLGIWMLSSLFSYQRESCTNLIKPSRHQTPEHKLKVTTHLWRNSPCNSSEITGKCSVWGGCYNEVYQICIWRLHVYGQPTAAAPERTVCRALRLLKDKLTGDK